MDARRWEIQNQVVWWISCSRSLDADDADIPDSEDEDTVENDDIQADDSLEDEEGNYSDADDTWYISELHYHLGVGS